MLEKVVKAGGGLSSSRFSSRTRPDIQLFGTSPTSRTSETCSTRNAFASVCFNQERCTSARWSRVGHTERGDTPKLKSQRVSGCSCCGGGTVTSSSMGMTTCSCITESSLGECRQTPFAHSSAILPGKMFDKIYRKLVDELQFPVPSLKIFLYYLEVKIDAQEFNYRRGLFQSEVIKQKQNFT